MVAELAEGSGITLTGRYSSGYAEFRHLGHAALGLRGLSGRVPRRLPRAHRRARPAIPSPAAPVTGSTRGEIALAFGRAQLGEPYVFGATGPNRWDCSGLTQAAWRAAGICIPRTTYTQVKIGRRVARSDLQPG